MCRETKMRGLDLIKLFEGDYSNYAYKECNKARQKELKIHVYLNFWNLCVWSFCHWKSFAVRLR